MKASRVAVSPASLRVLLDEAEAHLAICTVVLRARSPRPRPRQYNAYLEDFRQVADELAAIADRVECLLKPTALVTLLPIEEYRSPCTEGSGDCQQQPTSSGWNRR